MAFTWTVRLTQGDVGGAGRTLTEDYWQLHFAKHGGSPYAGFILSGFDDGSPTGLTQPINTGVAFINGLRVSVTSTESVTLTDDATNHVYIELTESGGNVNDGQLVVNTSGTAPSSTLSIKILKIVTSSGTVSSSIDVNDDGAFGAGIHGDPRNDLMSRDGTRDFTAAPTFESGYTVSGGAVAMTSATSVTVPAPTADTHSSTKKYVDDTVSGTFVIKSSTETVNSSTTLQDDDVLLFAIGTTETWYFEIVCDIVSDATADFKFDVNGPTDHTMDGFFLYGHQIGEGLSQETGHFNEGSTLSPALVAGTEFVLHITGIAVTAGTSGNITLRWAQRLSDAVSTQVLLGSWIRAYKLA